MGVIKLILLSMIACVANAMANTLWKLQFNQKPINIESICGFAESVFALRILLGVACYGLSMLLFFYLLSHYRMAEVVPMLSMTYIFNLVAAYFVFGDIISVGKLVGIGLILIGIIIYAYN